MVMVLQLHSLVMRQLFPHLYEKDCDDTSMKEKTLNGVYYADSTEMTAERERVYEASIRTKQPEKNGQLSTYIQTSE